LKKAIDPILKSAAKRKLSADNFVLTEDEKKGANCDTKSRERLNA
jgi:hypothetical protein